jgi:hypothetical protein
MNSSMHYIITLQRKEWKLAWTELVQLAVQSEQTWLPGWRRIRNQFHSRPHVATLWFRAYVRRTTQCREMQSMAHVGSYNISFKNTLLRQILFKDSHLREWSVFLCARIYSFVKRMTWCRKIRAKNSICNRHTLYQYRHLHPRKNLKS